MPAPRWLWWLSWLLLAGALCFSIGGGSSLLAGAANAPHTGTSYTDDQPSLSTPFQIEVSATFLDPVQPNEYWAAVVFWRGQPLRTFRVYNDRTFTVTGYFGAIRTGFPRLNVGAENNRLTLTVEANGAAELRLNDDIAWRGPLSMDTVEIRYVASRESAVRWGPRLVYR